MSHVWTSDEITFLRDNYSEMSSQKIATHLGVSIWSVKAKAYCLDIIATPAESREALGLIRTAHILRAKHTIMRPDNDNRGKVFKWRGDGRMRKYLT